MISNQRIGVEEPSTINAEFLGWQDGNSVWRQNFSKGPVPIDWGNIKKRINDEKRMYV